jgi:hypothetical protein
VQNFGALLFDVSKAFRHENLLAVSYGSSSSTLGM